MVHADKSGPRPWFTDPASWAGRGSPRPPHDGLRPVDDFGSNPGRLAMLLHVPADAPGPMPLVVVLHGCMQTAQAYDDGAGWSALADRLGFAVLYPEQQRRNNPNLCFNWFSRPHMGRDGGEALSIRQMVERASADHPIDPRRIFVTGLSAGGAMASIMLAAWPEVFAAGAIVAGLGYRAATTMRGALDAMGRGSGRAADDMAAAVRAASAHAGPWPRVSVWHGTLDEVVSPANAGEIIDQWRLVHGLPAEPSETAADLRGRRRIWRNAAGEAVLDERLLHGIGHGTPVERADATIAGPGPFFLEAGVSSTEEIAEFFGLGRVARRSPKAGWAPSAADLVETLIARPAGAVAAAAERLVRQITGRG